MIPHLHDGRAERSSRRRWPPALLAAALLALPACGAEIAGVPLLGAAAVVEGASVVVFGRAAPDLVVSAVTGRDCSVVRLDRGESYCAQPEVAEPQPFCTRSLGAVDCWRYPPAAYPAYRGVADAPPPSPATEARRNRRWPGLF